MAGCGPVQFGGESSSLLWSIESFSIHEPIVQYTFSHFSTKADFHGLVIEEISFYLNDMNASIETDSNSSTFHISCIKGKCVKEVLKSTNTTQISTLKNIRRSPNTLKMEGLALFPCNSEKIIKAFRHLILLSGGKEKKELF